MAGTQMGPVVVFGGSGFVGRHIVRRLAKDGFNLRVVMRRPNEALFLKTAGRTGQIELVQGNIRDEASSRSALEGASAVINAVGILYETGPQKFDAVQNAGAARLASLAAEQGIDRFIHISAIGADAGSASAYARSKAEGETAILAACPKAHVLRPSIVVGPEDDFFNRFARMAQIAPALPLVGGGLTRYQPVGVFDVAQAVDAPRGGIGSKEGAPDGLPGQAPKATRAKPLPHSPSLQLASAAAASLAPRSQKQGGHSEPRAVPLGSSATAQSRCWAATARAGSSSNKCSPAPRSRGGTNPKSGSASSRVKATDVA